MNTTEIASTIKQIMSNYDNNFIIIICECNKYGMYVL